MWNRAGVRSSAYFPKLKDKARDLVQVIEALMVLDLALSPPPGEIAPSTRVWRWVGACTEPQTLEERVKWLESVRAENYPCIVAEVVDDAPATGGMRTVGWCNLGHYNMRPAYDG